MRPESDLSGTRLVSFFLSSTSLAALRSAGAWAAAATENATTEMKTIRRMSVLVRSPGSAWRDLYSREDQLRSSKWSGLLGKIPLSGRNHPLQPEGASSSERTRFNT